MLIIEQIIIPKNPAKKSEDGIVVTPDFIAVIDGATSKSAHRYSLFSSNGRYAMQVVAKYIKKVKSDVSCQQFCNGVTHAVARHYRYSRLKHLGEYPEDRLTASCIVFSRLRREIWMIGDCQCLIKSLCANSSSLSEPVFFNNPKPYEQELADQRAAIIMADTRPHQHYLHDDTARAAIIPRMLETMHEQNVSYAVVDGFPIPQRHVRIITLNFQPWEIVLASDGYPFLCPTLQESEQRLAQQKATDPLNIRTFKATKGFLEGNNSFDDRAYIRFKV